MLHAVDRANILAGRSSVLAALVLLATTALSACSGGSSNGNNTGNTPPTITSQPQNQTVMVGATATFSVTATGTAPLAYQWSKDGAIIGGATDSSYTTPATVIGDNGSTFTVMVTNVAGSQASTAATLTVNGGPVAPNITTHPQDQSVTVGAAATFSVVASGTAPLTYQWSRNGTAINGATNASYTTPATVIGDNGSTFTVMVTNVAGSQTSTAATLTVTAAAVAPTIVTEPQSQTVVLGATATFSVAATGTAPLMYQWSKNGAAISGAASSSYTTPATLSADNGSSFTVTVTNVAGSQTSTAATLTVNAPPTITTQPQSQTVTVGATATFSVVATGTAPLTYQWSKNGAAISGATNSTYTTPATVSGDNGSTFTVKVTNVAGSKMSTAATLTVNVPPAITSQPQSQSVTVGATATFSVVATGTTPLTYQWSKNGATISGATNSTYTTAATVSGDNGSTFTVKVTNVAGSKTSAAAILTVNVPPAITTQPLSQSVTVGATATFSVVATGTAPLTYQWSKNGAAIGGATNSSYTTPATVSTDNGSTFTVMITNVAGSKTSNAAILTVTGGSIAPTIITQPQSQTVAVGATATFSVVATGTAPLAYQWSKNGATIGGATNSSYTTPATVSGDNGSTFTVTVSNVAGSKTSSAATLTVNAAGIGTPIMFQHIASSTDPAGNGISGHNFVFRTEALPANTVAVIGVSAPASITPTISDTLVGSWAAALCSASGGTGNTKASVFVQALGAAGGADTITINVGSSSTQPVQFDVTFWENINTSAPGNGSLCTGGISPTSGGVINPGSFTPTSNNDASGGNVIWNYTPICSLVASSNASLWTAAGGFTLLNGDIIWLANGFPEASQYYVQATSASVTPSITATGEGPSGDCFNSVSVALAVADNGASAPSTIHVAKIIHESYITFLAPGTQKVQFPTVGNLRVATFTWADGCPGAGAGCVSGLSSSDGCAWTLQIPNGGAGIAYAENCSPCPNCTVNVIYSGGQQLPQASFRLYDVQNAAPTSYQNIVGSQGGCSTSVTNAPSITPSGASNGLMIAALGNGNGPITAVTSPSGAAFDLWTFSGQTDNDLADNADASSHLYYSSTATQNWNYTKTNGNDQCYWAAAAFN